MVIWQRTPRRAEASADADAADGPLRPSLPNATEAAAAATELRAWVERRVQDAELMAVAIADERLLASRELLEGRIQDAEAIAQAFADQGLRVHGAALAAMGKKLAELDRRNRELLADRAALEARIAACEALIQVLRAEAGVPADPSAPPMAGPCRPTELGRSPPPSSSARTDGSRA